MKYRFSTLRLLIAVPIFAVPFFFFRDEGLLGAMVAGVISASAAGACLIGGTRELRNIFLTMLASFFCVLPLVSGADSLVKSLGLRILDSFLVFILFMLGVAIFLGFQRISLAMADDESMQAVPTLELPSSPHAPTPLPIQIQVPLWS